MQGVWKGQQCLLFTDERGDWYNSNVCNNFGGHFASLKHPAAIAKYVKTKFRIGWLISNIFVGKKIA